LLPNFQDLSTGEPLSTLGLTITNLQTAYQTGRLRPTDVLAQALERARNSPAGVFICKLEARALREAQESDRRWKQGAQISPIDGVPIVWKDLFDVKGTPTTAGSELRRHVQVAQADAFAVDTLTQAGAVNLGKVGLSEFAYSGLGLNPHFGTPPNPWSRDGARAPGGSSSGTAVSISSGIVAMGMGTDTGGSVRVPAAFQGLVGYRPTSRRLNKSGVYPLSRTLDDIGPIARTVEDCALVDALLRGKKPLPLTPMLAGEMRIVVPKNIVFDDAEPEVLELFAGLLERLQREGARIEHLEIPAMDELQKLTEMHGTITAAEGYRWHQAIVDSPDAQRIDRRVLSRLQRGRTMLAVDWLEIHDSRIRLQREVAAILDNAWLLMPTVVHVAPLVAALEADDNNFHNMNLRTLRNTSMGNFFDLCGISLPMGLGMAGMPLGALLSGPSGCDDALFRAAATVEQCV
jgi:aspartyl-tRNA(Asn)/glutamyl-tRNA(Gln) amidotransferase subunit A